MNIPRLTLLAMAFTALVGSQAHCALMAFDNFAVTLAGDACGPLNGETNGFAWAAGYEEQWQGYLITNEPPLGYSTVSQILVTNGGFASGGSAWTSSGRRFDTGNDWDPNSGAPTLTSVLKRVTGFNTGLIGADGADIWISFLARNNAGGGYRVSFNSGSFGWYEQDDQAGLPFVRVNISGSQWALEAKGTNAGNTLVSTGISRTLGDSYLMVLNLVFSDGNDIAKLYVNPSSLAGTAPASADATLNITNDLFFRQMTFFPGTDPGQGDMDELRVGDSYAVVTPVVPEPALLLSLAMGAIWLRKRT